MSAGLAAVLHHDVALNDEHPPLPKVLAVLPVLFGHPVVAADGTWSRNDELGYGAHFVAAQLAAGKLRSVTFASRLVPLAETADVCLSMNGNRRRSSRLLTWPGCTPAVSRQRQPIR